MLIGLLSVPHFADTVSSGLLLKDKDCSKSVLLSAPTDSVQITDTLNVNVYFFLENCSKVDKEVMDDVSKTIIFTAKVNDSILGSSTLSSDPTMVIFDPSDKQITVTVSHPLKNIPITFNTSRVPLFHRNISMTVTIAEHGRDESTNITVIIVDNRGIYFI